MKKIALVVGHSSRRRGAYNQASGVREYNLAEDLIDDIIDAFHNQHRMLGVDITKFYRTNGVQRLVTEINRHGVGQCSDSRQPYATFPIAYPNQGVPDFLLAIEFHFNAFSKKASGTEMLIAKDKYSQADQVRIFALSKRIANAIGINNRGLKPTKFKQDGGYFLHKTKAKWTILAETFFIDNDSDLEKANKYWNAIVQQYVNFIYESI